MQPRVRDYIDLYFIIKNSSYLPEKYLSKVRLDSQSKFDWPLEAKNLAVALIRVKDFKKQEFPKMLVPFNQKDMENFYLAQAKKMESEIFKN